MGKCCNCGQDCTPMGWFWRDGKQYVSCGDCLLPVAQHFSGNEQR